MTEEPIQLAQIWEQTPDSPQEASEMSSIRATTLLDAGTEYLIKKDDLTDEIQRGDLNLAELELYKMGLVDKHGDAIPSTTNEDKELDRNEFLKALEAFPVGTDIEAINPDDPALDPALRAYLKKYHKHEHEVIVEIPPEPVYTEATQEVTSAPVIPQKEQSHTVEHVIDFAAIAALATTMAQSEPLESQFSREVEARNMTPEPSLESQFAQEVKNRELAKGLDFAALSNLAASMKSMGIEERSMPTHEEFKVQSVPNVRERASNVVTL